NLPSNRACIVHHVAAADAHGPRCRCEGGGEDRDRGALTGPVRAEQGEKLSGLNVKTDPIDGVHGSLSVAFDEIPDLDHMRGSISPRGVDEWCLVCHGGPILQCPITLWRCVWR